MIAECFVEILGLAAATEIEAARAELIPFIPPPTVCEWIMTESSGDAQAVSPTGDRGLLQISEKYQEYFLFAHWEENEPFDVFDPVDNATLAFRIYFNWVAFYKAAGVSDLEQIWLAFASYNAGYEITNGARYANKIMAVYFDIFSQKEAERALSALRGELGGKSKKNTFSTRVKFLPVSKPVRPHRRFGVIL